jgi:nitrate reductase gamma subunit
VALRTSQPAISKRLLNPEPELMTGAHVTFIFQFHVTVVWLLFAFWPFSRLVHAWSIPVDYLRRSPIVYRSRTGRPRRAARAGRPADVAAARAQTPSR